MGIVINHMLFGPVATVNMRMTGSDHHTGRFRNLTIRGRVKQLPFLQGNYSIDLWLGDGSRDIDVVKSCLHFRVVGTDVYGSGRLPNEKFGVAFLNADWELKQNGDSARAAVGAAQ
jgi:hypothetical protein